MNLPQQVSEATRKRNPGLYGGFVPATKQSGLNQGVGTASGKRIKQDTKPLMNKLEASWFAVLATGQYEGKAVTNLRAQSLRFKIGNGCWVKPDISCLVEGKQHCFECKGPKQMKNVARGMLALKTVSFAYPEIQWVLVWKENGHWQKQNVLS